MDDKKKYVLTIVLVLVAGLLGGFMVAEAMDGGRHRKDAGHEMGYNMHAQMESMTANLEGKKGKEFDMAFLSEMVAHHDGAINMAQLALENAEHEELKALARTIIEAQMGEAAQMQAWQTAWSAE